MTYRVHMTNAETSGPLLAGAIYREIERRNKDGQFQFAQSLLAASIGESQTKEFSAALRWLREQGHVIATPMGEMQPWSYVSARLKDSMPEQPTNDPYVQFVGIPQSQLEGLLRHVEWAGTAIWCPRCRLEQIPEVDGKCSVPCQPYQVRLESAEMERDAKGLNGREGLARHSRRLQGVPDAPEPPKPTTIEDFVKAF